MSLLRQCFSTTQVRLFFFALIFSLPCYTVAAERAASHIVSHAMGKTQVSSAPVRVVTLFQGATDSMVALGMTPIGVVDSWAQQPTYQYLRQALSGVTHVGLETQPNLEAIAALKPDLIIGAKSRHEKIYGQLSLIAPTVLAENVYDYQHTLVLTAESVGRVKQGLKIWQDWLTRIQTFRTSIQSKVDHWPLTASILNIRADHLRLYLRESFPGSVLKEVGFRFPMPEKTGWGVKLKSKEALPSANADVFFMILDSDDVAVQQNYQAWQDHPLWKVLTAPRTHQVYQVDRISWLLSGGILGANLMLDELSDVYHLNKN